MGNRDIYIIVALFVGAAVFWGWMLATDTPWTVIFAWIQDLQK